MRPGSALKKAKKRKKEKKKTQRCDKSHICPDHPGCATLTKVVMWGGIPDLVNHAKFHQNRLRGFGSLRGRNLSFSYAWHYGLYNRLGLPPNLWWKKYKIHTRKQKWIYAQWNGPSETKSNPENCKNCSSKCAYHCAQLQYTIQHMSTVQAKSHNGHIFTYMSTCAPIETKICTR